MKCFVLNLRKDTREELYNDIAVDFLNFLLIEAIFNANQLSSPQSLLDVEYSLEDPDSQFETSVEYLLKVLQESYKNGPPELIPCEEDFEINSEIHDLISVRLGLAMESIQSANCPITLKAIGDLFLEPEFKHSFKFNAVHTSGVKNPTVTFTISSDFSFVPDLNTYNLDLLNH